MYRNDLTRVVLLALCACGLLAACGRPAEEQAGSQEPGTVSLEVLPDELERLREPWAGDLEGMIERRTIRAAVVYSGQQYFFEDGQPRGIVYELLQQLEQFVNRKQQTKTLAVHVVAMPVTRDQLLPLLRDGRADIAAAALTITPARAAQVAFTEPLVTDVREVLITGPAAPAIARLHDLAGQEVHVRRSSSYYESLLRLNEGLARAGLAPVAIVAANELLEDEDLLEMVDAGLVPMTIVDSYKADFWVGVFDEVSVRHDLAVREGGEIAWALRKDTPELEALLNEFVRTHRRGSLVGNVLAQRYYGQAEGLHNALEGREIGKLRPLLELFQRFGSEYGVDWLLLAAMSYQESGLDQSKRSPAGAVGVMQIKPATARDANVAIDDVTTLENNIEAGTKYLRFLKDRYFDDPEIDPLERWLFTLAAYNAGPRRIARLRRAAARQGLDPDRWFDNVEVIAARDIGAETVRYVRNIFRYYVAYKLVWERNQLRQQLEASVGAAASCVERVVAAPCRQLR